jgi:hypothetical protein
MRLPLQLHGRLRWRRLGFQVSMGKKFVRLHLNGKSWAWWHICVIPARLGNINRRMVIQAKSKTLSPN